VRSYEARIIADRRFAGLGYGLVAVLLLFVAGCVTSPPVQEMSDARQAIAVAKKAGAAELAATELGEAVAYMESAQKNLSERHYAMARTDALHAKSKALDALSLAESEAENEPH